MSFGHSTLEGHSLTSLQRVLTTPINFQHLLHHQGAVLFNEGHLKLYPEAHRTIYPVQEIFTLLNLQQRCSRNVLKQGEPPKSSSQHQGFMNNGPGEDSQQPMKYTFYSQH